MGTVNVIFDDRHTPNDYGRLLEEFIVQGITKYKFHNAIILKDSVVDSIAASHKKIVQDYKDKGISQCIIMEQDCTFTSPNAWKFFLDNKPQSFDLYLWGSYIQPISNKKICGFQLFIISSKFYDAFLSVPKNNHIDTAMDNIDGDYHFCYPYPALQRAGFSANNPNAPVNYNALLKEEDIYRG